MRLTAILLTLCLSCLLIACGAGDNTDNSPARPGASLDDQADRDWRFRSQYKTHMRHLWIDANRAAGAGRGELEPTWHEIRASATDIAARANLLGGYWADIEERCATVVECAEDDDRIGASDELKALGAACDGCHLATWSPAFLHVTLEIMDGWLKNQPARPGVGEVDAEPPPAIPNREAMKELWFHLQMAEMRVQQWQLEDLKSELEEIRTVAAQRAHLWKTVGDNATLLQKQSISRKREGMKEAYLAMTSGCAACHARNAGGDRPIMAPMPWE